MNGQDESNLGRLAAGLLIVGVSGVALEPWEGDLLLKLQPGGVILFGRNVATEEQLLALVREIRARVPKALLCVDAEGGRVDRFRAVVGAAPSAARLGKLPVRKARQSGRWIGHSMRCFDCDLDFAPVIDLDHGQQDNALDGRYFGDHPSAVVARGAAFLEGLQGAGVLGCVKHFPGLGAAHSDTHHHPASVDLGPNELARDLGPFRSLMTQAGAVMIGHAIYPSLDPSRTPGTLSTRIASGLLRDNLGFEGLAISDDLEMKALDPWGDLSQRTVRALEAGCDALPICSRLEETPSVAEDIGSSVNLGRLKQASSRWQSYRDRLHQLRRISRTYKLATVRRRLVGLTT